MEDKDAPSKPGIKHLALCYLLQNCAAVTNGVGSIRLSRIETTLRVMSCGNDALKLFVRAPKRLSQLSLNLESNRQF